MKYQEIGSLTWNVPIVDPATGVPTPDFGRKWQRNNSNGDVTRGELAKKADKSTRIIAGDGLTGGGDLSQDRTIAHADSPVVPGTYGSGSMVPVIEVDQLGHVISASATPVSGGGGGGSTPAIRGSNIQSSNNSSYTVTWPVGTVAGDVVLIFGGHGFGINTPAGWVSLGKLDGTNFNGAVIAKVMTPSDITTGSVTVTTAGAFNGVLVCVALDGATVTTMTTAGYFARAGTGIATFNAPVIAASGTNLVLLFLANRAASNDTSDKGVLVQSINAAAASGALYAVDPASSGFAAALSFSVAGSGYYIAQIAISGP